ncbi:MAG: hypothetical protein K0M48_05505 [Thiobacillus sp.]|nr:hypothetical protein [Thiobacillus sp.]
MDTHNRNPDRQADLLAEDTLYEFADDPFDEFDEYDAQYNYAGCYPWLAEVICAQPREIALLPSFLDSDTSIEDADTSC